MKMSRVGAPGQVHLRVRFTMDLLQAEWTAGSPLCSSQRLYVSVHWQWESVNAPEILGRTKVLVLTRLAEVERPNASLPKSR